MSQNNANHKRTEDSRDGDQGDNILATAREEADTRDTRMDLGLLPNWTLDEYHRVCASMMGMKRFAAMAVAGKNLVIYDSNRFERDTALGMWKRHWAVQSRWCVGIRVDTRLADMPFVRCEQEPFYCSNWRDAINANMEVAERDPKL